MIPRTSLLGLFVLLALPWAAPQDARASGPDLDFEVVLTVSRGWATPGDYVFRDEASWCAFWHLLIVGPALVVPPPCPPIDFQHEIVIASVSERKPNTCYSLAIGPIERIKGRRAVQVTVNERAPAPDGGCICSREVTNPAQAVVLSRPLGRIEFVHAVTEFSCNGT